MKKAVLAMTLVVISGAAMADPAGRANTTDPNSAPLATQPHSPSPIHRGGVTNDAASRANTTDPNSAPGMGRAGTVGRGDVHDKAGRANTADPNTTNGMH
jgi:hypothetical protein